MRLPNLYTDRPRRSDNWLSWIVHSTTLNNVLKPLSPVFTHEIKRPVWFEIYHKKIEYRDYIVPYIGPNHQYALNWYVGNDDLHDPRYYAIFDLKSRKNQKNGVIFIEKLVLFWTTVPVLDYSSPVYDLRPHPMPSYVVMQNVAIVHTDGILLKFKTENVCATWTIPGLLDDDIGLLRGVREQHYANPTRYTLQTIYSTLTNYIFSETWTARRNGPAQIKLKNLIYDYIEDRIDIGSIEYDHCAPWLDTLDCYTDFDDIDAFLKDRPHDVTANKFLLNESDCLIYECDVSGWSDIAPFYENFFEMRDIMTELNQGPRAVILTTI